VWQSKEKKFRFFLMLVFISRFYTLDKMRRFYAAHESYNFNSTGQKNEGKSCFSRIGNTV